MEYVEGRNEVEKLASENAKLKRELSEAQKTAEERGREIAALQASLTGTNVVSLGRRGPAE